MKKIFFLLFFILSNNIIQAQKFDCIKCDGKGIIDDRDWIICSNCKDWSSSYRNKIPCNVCHDNRGYFTAWYKKKCPACNGTGRNIVAESYWAIIKIIEENGSYYANGYEVGKCLGYLDCDGAKKALTYLEDDWTIPNNEYDIASLIEDPKFGGNLFYLNGNPAAFNYEKTLWTIQGVEDCKSTKQYFFPIRKLTKSLDKSNNYVRHRSFDKIKSDLTEIETEIDNCNKIKTLSIPTNEEMKKALLGKRIDTWNFDKLEEFKNFYSLDYRHINCDNLEQSTCEMKVYIDLVDYISSQPYDCEATLKYEYKEGKWTFKEIVSGFVKKHVLTKKEEEKEKKQNELDDIYKNIKVEKSKSKVEYIFNKPCNKDVFKSFFSERSIEILGLYDCKYITLLEGKYDRDGKITKVKIKWITSGNINHSQEYSVYDGEAFQVASRGVLEMEWIITQ